jgi:DNA-binding NarL/FixJ family response regulator
MNTNVHPNYKYKSDLIEWCRSQVLERLAQGATQTQIAQELQLHPAEQR